MTAKRPELKDLFSDGKLPTGEHFSQLIDAMVHKDELQKHEDAFEEWTDRGEIQLGKPDGKWRLYVDAGGNVRLEPEDVSAEEKSPEAADVQLHGWVSMGGRLGTVTDREAFSKPELELDVSTIPSVPCDAQWHSIVDMPGHACAFEVVAATARPVTRGRRGTSSILRMLLGFPRPVNSVVHAIVSANGTDEKPQLTTRTHPDSARAWKRLRGYLLALFVIFMLAVAATQSEPDIEAVTSDIETMENQIRMDLLREIRAEIKESAGQEPDKPPSPPAKDPKQDSEPKGVLLSGTLVMIELLGVKGSESGEEHYLKAWVIFVAVNLLILLRLFFGALITRRNSVRLRWFRDSGGLLTGDRRWSLKLWGPEFEHDQEPPSVYYHITRLWS